MAPKAVPKKAVLKKAGHPKPATHEEASEPEEEGEVSLNGYHNNKTVLTFERRKMKRCVVTVASNLR